MSAAQVWLAIGGMGLITSVTRALFLIGGERMILPERVQRALRYAPAAALVAVVVPDLLDTPDGLSIAFSNHALYASLCGLAWFLWRGSLLWGGVFGGVVCSFVIL